MKTFILSASIAVLFAACGGNQEAQTTENKPQPLGDNTSATTESGNPTYDPNRGEGKFTSVDLGEKLDMAMAGEGEKVAGVKCFSCHKTTGEKLVGPGWKGVTARRKAPWIMNFITNPDPMIDKDPAMQSQLELCLVRMPNQGLNDEEARKILEFMRKNDGVQ